ncbi:PRD domain-containing protein [Lactobacillus halodurans]|uniref:DNA translocase FtsK n=2 Tax=Companilactobacillus halodurans TaxID=2584183 RepID=A0A5P0ZMN0_9LACO|nr:sigma 54-interacting transcriptional regulator [Companilactobacillus halodurans]MQS75442.1 PRD domain-containing protein [Companilactobacillus halodurans]
MTKAVDKVLKIIQDKYSKNWVDTKTIAEDAGLSRSVISIYLSQLYKENKLTKKNGRPVLWKLIAEKNPFQDMIGSTGSLKEIVKRCQESIVYPPNGFPIIITGPSGVGKSFLAKNIYKQAKSIKAIDSQAKFITLNAADYANNPELLSSVLFGYKKGAFTGANEDTLGLIDQANNGYFFLDEVHRLPKESQEKLFSLLDSGQFYPLGENKIAHKVKVRFIFATTEELDSFLLKTFMRRVPLHVKLPAFKKRPLVERLSLIFDAFKNEAIRTNKEYFISNQIIEELSQNKAAGNIGAVENAIKLLCAAVYTEHTNDSKIYIGTKDNRDSYVAVSKDFDVNNYSSLQKRDYDLLSNVHQELLNSVENNNNISDQVLLLMKFLKKIDYLKDDVLIENIEFKVKQAIKNVLTRKYGVKLSLSDDELYQISFGMSLYYFISNNDFKMDQLVKKFENLYPRTMYIYNRFLDEVNSDEKFKELSIPWLLLLFKDKIKMIESIKYTGIILAHGDNTATSIQSVVNNLCGNYIFEAFDMPIDVSIHEINEYVQKYIKSQKDREHKGIFVLFDMGSLTQMFTEIKKYSNCELLVINNVTTATALDTGIRIQRNDTFNDITKAANRFGKAFGTQYYEGLSDKLNIIVSCMSGVGLSEEIKRMMLESLSNKFEIITMDYKDLKQTLENHEQKFFDKTKFVVTTTDIDTNLDIDIINIYDIMEKSGYNYLERLLLDSGEQKPNIEALMDKMLKFFTIEGIKDRLQFLNPDVVIDEVQLITQKYQEYYDISFDGKTKLNLYMHLSLMIERMLVNARKEENSNVSFDSEKEKEFYSVSKAIFKSIELKYNFKVNDYEISLMYQLLHSYI